MFNFRVSRNNPEGRGFERKDAHGRGKLQKCDNFVPILNQNTLIVAIREAKAIT